MEKYTAIWSKEEGKEDIIIHADSKDEAEYILEDAQKRNLIEWDYGAEEHTIRKLGKKKLDEDRLQEFGWDEENGRAWVKPNQRVPLTNDEVFSKIKTAVFKTLRNIRRFDKEEKGADYFAGWNNALDIIEIDLKEALSEIYFDGDFYSEEEV